MLNTSPIRRWLRTGSAVGIATLSVLQFAPVAAAGPPTMTLSQTQMVNVRNLVQQNGDDFAGIGVSALSRTVEIYRVATRIRSQTAQSVTASISQIATSDDGRPKVWSVSFLDVKYSLKQLMDVQNRINTTEPWASDSAAFLSVWYVDPPANAVHVDLTEITASVKTSSSVFGDMVRLGVQERPSPASRSNDSPPPWWGGDDLSLSSGGSPICTAGYGAVRRSNGHSGMLTAGHCFGLNNTVYQSTATMGTVTVRTYGGSNYDAEFVDAPGGVAAHVYVTPSGGTPVDSLDATPGVGDSICTDGMVSGENCNATIQETNLCVLYNDGQTVCHLDAATSTNGSWIVRLGDSGGPVYFYPGGGGVVADGLISGKTGTAQGSTTVFFTPIGPDLSGTFRLICSGVCS
jgi:hypothetical protein